MQRWGVTLCSFGCFSTTTPIILDQLDWDWWDFESNNIWKTTGSPFLLYCLHVLALDATSISCFHQEADRFHTCPEIGIPINFWNSKETYPGVKQISFSQLYRFLLCVKMVTEASPVGDAENATGAPVVLHVFFLHNYPLGAGDRRIPGVPEPNMVPLSRLASSAPKGWEGSEKGPCAQHFYVLEVSEQEKLAACEIPPSVILFIHAARAICFVSAWKLCLDHGLIALFAELIVLFDLPFSQDACGNRMICLARRRRRRVGYFFF